MKTSVVLISNLLGSGEKHIRLFEQRNSNNPPILAHRMARFLHTKARTALYPGSNVQRFAVPDAKVPWTVWSQKKRNASSSRSSERVRWLLFFFLLSQEAFPEYAPPDYTASVVLAGPVWADLDFSKPNVEGPAPKHNEVDGKGSNCWRGLKRVCCNSRNFVQVDRRSFEGAYEVADGLPRNPFGRTGLQGKRSVRQMGSQPCCGPNRHEVCLESHFAFLSSSSVDGLSEPRWQRNEQGEPILVDNKKVLEFVAIKRKDNGEWAIPGKLGSALRMSTHDVDRDGVQKGGMVEPGDTVSVTLKKEFGEEALNSLAGSEEVSFFFYPARHEHRVYGY